jgi:hypothetical protein
MHCSVQEKEGRLLVYDQRVMSTTRSRCEVPVTKINYLCTYDFYGPVRNVFDAGRYIRGGVGGGLALEIESFVSPLEMASSR